jgi:transketolase
MEMNMTKLSPAELQKIAREVRCDVIEMIYKAQTGHPGGSLSATEILVALYFGIMETNDRFFLSNGHVCPALYSVMAEAGHFSKSELSAYATLGSKLQGHPERTKLKGIENTSGPLGLGLAQAAGYAVWKKDSFIYCMTSDAEHDEGNHWEAVNFAAKYKLNNLIQIVDKNGIQIEGTVEEIMPLGNLKASHNQPTLIIASTIFGKGVSYMENNPDWHAKAPNDEEYKKAMEELKC